MAKKRVWNKGKIIGAKPALTPDQIQAIRLILAERGNLRDRVLFALAIDSSLRGCDLLRLRVCDVSLAGSIRDTVRVQPSKTRKTSHATVAFPLTPDTEKLTARYIEKADLLTTDYLFTAVTVFRSIDNFTLSSEGHPSLWCPKSFRGLNSRTE